MPRIMLFLKISKLRDEWREAKKEFHKKSGFDTKHLVDKVGFGPSLDILQKAAVKVNKLRMNDKDTSKATEDLRKAFMNSMRKAKVYETAIRGFEDFVDEGHASKNEIGQIRREVSRLSNEMRKVHSSLKNLTLELDAAPLKNPSKNPEIMPLA